MPVVLIRDFLRSQQLKKELPMTDKRLDGKVAIITGAASGMGWASVHLFLTHGARVVGFDLNEENGTALVDSVGSARHGDNFTFVVGDVAQESDIEQVVATATETFGRLDVMFNNAGVGGAFGPLIETDIQHWDDTFAINMRGVFLGTKHAAKQMISQGQGGAIVNTASVAGLGGGSGPVAYSAAKAGVVNFGQNAAIELARHRIRVNTICPGMVFTPLMHRGREEEAEATMKQIQPWPDRGTPDHIANAALYLASDESEFVTGEAHVVDGGYSAYGGLMGAQFAGMGGQTKAGVAYGTTGKAPVVRDVDR